MSISQPVGPPVDATASDFPGDVTLTGRFGTVERLNARRHGPSLIEAMRGHDPIWTYIFVGPFADDAALSRHLAECETNKERIFYAVVRPEGRTIGILALMEIRPAARVIEVGNIVYTPALQRTPLATEAQYLIARYVFETLRYRRYEWKCDSLNAPSRQAAARFGFSFEGIFRQHMIVKGRSRDTAWFSMLDTEWPARKVAFERWLEPQNFDSNGRQKNKLGG